MTTDVILKFQAAKVLRDTADFFEANPDKHCTGTFENGEKICLNMALTRFANVERKEQWPVMTSECEHPVVDRARAALTSKFVVDSHCYVNDTCYINNRKDLPSIIAKCRQAADELESVA
jgi:hypothetical protein